MKKVILMSIMVLLLSKTFSQRFENVEDEKTHFAIANDVKLTTPQSGSDNSTANGTLGFSFKKGYLYGNLSFNLLNKNAGLSTNDSNNVKVFSNNLLQPDNSGSGLSSFNFAIGLKSLKRYETGDNLLKDHQGVVDYLKRRFGFYLFYNVNNTIWKKDTISSQVSIISPGLFLTYNILERTLDNEDKDQFHLSAFFGVQMRFLGGDLGLSGNTALRKHFLNIEGSDPTTFVGTTFGIKLDVGKFYGKMQQTYFSGKYDINGFSGYQSLITIGANLDIGIK